MGGGTIYSQEQLISKWDDFFTTDFTFINQELVIVGFFAIDKKDSDLADYLLDHPFSTIYAGEQAILNMMPPDLVDKGITPKLRIINLPEANHIQISKLRAEHLGKFVALEGVVRKTTEVRPDMRLSVYQCLRCYAITKKEQETTVEVEPLECAKEQGGCGRTATSTAFKRLTHQCSFIDTQRIELMEPPEGLGKRGQPEPITVFLSYDLTGQLKPGDRITINGVIQGQQRISRLRGKSTTFDIYIEANSIEMKERGYEEVKITEAEEIRIKNLAKNPEIFNMMVDAFAPTIYGMEVEKGTILLHLFSGITKHMPDGIRIRGDIHVQLVGDPGTAKSQLIHIANDTAPVGVYVSGKKASGPGLGATVSRDSEFGGGRWVLEPGAAVLADNGNLAIDEIDKMDKAAQDVLYEVMEQQEVSIAKASITASMKARCSILAGANPKHGRFDEYQPTLDQIDMEPALFSRFDVVLPISDRVNKEKDFEMAAHVLRAHQAGEMAKNVEELRNEHHTIEEVAEKLKPFRKPMNREFIRKYIAYTRKFCFPVMSNESLQQLCEYYTTLRNKAYSEWSTVAITIRQLEGMVRLAEAHARMRLSNAVEDCDIRRVIAICEYFLSKVASDRGVLDIDVIATGIAKSERDKIVVVLDAIRYIDNASINDILKHVENSKIEREELIKIIEKLRRRGEIFNPRDDVWKVVK